MTEHQAMVSCLQLAEDYSYLMKKNKLRYGPLTPKTFLFESRRHKNLKDRNIRNLRHSILRNYNLNLKILESLGGN